MVGETYSLKYVHELTIDSFLHVDGVGIRMERSLWSVPCCVCWYHDRGDWIPSSYPAFRPFDDPGNVFEEHYGVGSIAQRPPRIRAATSPFYSRIARQARRVHPSPTNCNPSQIQCHESSNGTLQSFNLRSGADGRGSCTLT